MQTLFDGVYLLEGEAGGRPLQLVYLQGATTSLILDSGSAGDPAKFIAPQINAAGGDPSAPWRRSPAQIERCARLGWIINSHPDFDHTGGNAELKQIAPGARLACGRADAEACASPDNLIRLRYDAYRAEDHIYYSDDTLAFIRGAAGAPQPIELTLVGGEEVRLADDWVIEVVHVPGHSHGHLALWDKKHAALYGADAIHGAVCHNFAGEPALCPTYLHVDAYLATLAAIEQMPITTYVGCHWPVKRGAEIAAFCAESRAFVQRTDALLRDFLAAPHTLAEACHALGPQLGGWPRAVDAELVYVLKGHMEQLAAQGVITRRVRPGAGLEYMRV